MAAIVRLLMPSSPLFALFSVMLLLLLLPNGCVGQCPYGWEPDGQCTFGKCMQSSEICQTSTNNCCRMSSKQAIQAMRRNPKSGNCELTWCPAGSYKDGGCSVKGFCLDTTELCLNGDCCEKSYLPGQNGAVAEQQCTTNNPYQQQQQQPYQQPVQSYYPQQQQQYQYPQTYYPTATNGQYPTYTQPTVGYSPYAVQQQQQPVYQTTYPVNSQYYPTQQQQQQVAAYPSTYYTQPVVYQYQPTYQAATYPTGYATNAAGTVYSPYGTVPTVYTGAGTPISTSSVNSYVPTYTNAATGTKSVYSPYTNTNSGLSSSAGLSQAALQQACATSEQSTCGSTVVQNPTTACSNQLVAQTCPISCGLCGTVAGKK